MNEKEMMGDILVSQKQITDTYNSFANECSAPTVRDEFLNILNEEHQMQSEIFCEMQKRGWYPTQAADQQQISQVKMKFQNQ